jgi:hypothetical protein
LVQNVSEFPYLFVILDINILEYVEFYLLKSNFYMCFWRSVVNIAGALTGDGSALVTTTLRPG